MHLSIRREYLISSKNSKSLVRAAAGTATNSVSIGLHRGSALFPFHDTFKNTVVRLCGLLMTSCLHVSMKSSGKHRHGASA